MLRRSRCVQRPPQGSSDVARVIFDAARRSGVVLATTANDKPRRTPSPPRPGAAEASGTSQEYARHILRLHLNKKREERQSVSAVSRAIAEASKKANVPSLGEGVAKTRSRSRSPSPQRLSRSGTLTRPGEVRGQALPRISHTPAKPRPPSPAGQLLSVPGASATREATPSEVQSVQPPVPAPSRPVASDEPSKTAVSEPSRGVESEPITPTFSQRSRSGVDDFTAPEADPVTATPEHQPRVELKFDSPTESERAQVERRAEPRAAAAPLQGAIPAQPPSTRSQTDASSSSPSTAEQWAVIREQELASQRDAARRAEEERETRDRREAVRLAQEQWVHDRYKPQWAQPDTPAYPKLHELHTMRGASSDWTTALAKFDDLLTVARGDTAAHLRSATATHGLALLARVVARAPNDAHQFIVGHVERAADGQRLPDSAVASFRRAMWMRSDGRSFSEAIEPLGPKDWSSLPRAQLYKALRFKTTTDWQQACAIANAVRGEIHDPFCSVETTIAQSIKPRGREQRGAAVSVVRSIEQMLRAKLSELGKSHVCKLIRAYGTVGRPHDVARLYDEMVQRGELDEAVCAARLRWALTPHIKTLIPEMRKAGVNVLSPGCIASAMASMVSRREFSSAVELYGNYRERVPAEQIGGPVVRVLARIVLASELPAAASEDFLTAARVAFPQRPPTTCVAAMVTAFAAAHRYQEAIDLYDALPPFARNDRLADQVRDALNTCLRAVGRDTLPAPAAEDSGSERSRWGGQNVEQTAATAPPSPASVDSTALGLPSVEDMLELGRSRDWEAALAALATIPAILPPSTASGATLVYNCALSAAVDEPHVAEVIIQHMADRNVEMNSTTYNTVMSAYGRSSDRWSEALTRFATMPPDRCDASTYSVVLSVLAKRSLWLEASTVFNSMSAAHPTVVPSPVLYGLVVQASHNHSWQVALGAFRELHRAHGATAVKDLVLSRVVNALTRADKQVEAANVQDLMKAKGKKKKKPTS